jgi:hypothetical protein
VLPVLQLGAGVVLNENELLPLTFAANVDTFLRTWLLPQSGQAGSATAELLKMSSSKGVPQVWH